MMSTEIPPRQAAARDANPSSASRGARAVACSLALAILSPVHAFADAPPAPDPSVQQQARVACHQSLVTGRPVLLAFGADWCIDCKKLERLSAEAPLARALGEVHRVNIDVGRFDRHVDLITAFEVRSIARWVLTRPDRCDQPITSWPVLAASTLEPESGTDSPRTAADVAAWLRGARLQTPRRP